MIANRGQKLRLPLELIPKITTISSSVLFRGTARRLRQLAGRPLAPVFLGVAVSGRWRGVDWMDVDLNAGLKTRARTSFFIEVRFDGRSRRSCAQERVWRRFD